MTSAEDPPRRSPIERQVDIGLMVVMVLAAVIVVYGVVYLVTSWNDTSERTRSEVVGVAFVFLLLPGAVVFFTGRSARRRLRVRAVSAKLFSVLTGVFALLAGLPLATNPIGLLSVAAGLFVLVAALLLKRERPA